MTADREVLPWELFGSAADELAAGVAADGFAPDLILAVARGGLFVAGALGYALSVKNVAVMNVEFYTGVDRAPGCAGRAAAGTQHRRPRPAHAC